MNTKTEILTGASTPYHKSVLFPYHRSQIQSFLCQTLSLTLHSSSERLRFSKDHAFTAIKYPELLLVLRQAHVSLFNYSASLTAQL